MKNSLPRLLVLVLTLLGLTTSQLFAQLGLKSVGSVQEKDGPMQVTVVFTEPVDPTTATAIANYNLGAGVTINAITMMTGLPAIDEPGNNPDSLRGRVIDNQCAVLEVTGLGSAKTTVTVNNVKNAAGTLTIPADTKMDFNPSGYSWCEVARIYTKASDPGWQAPGHRKGKVIADSDNGFDIFNNGRAGWAGEDEFTFVYKPVDGNFDFKSRIEFQDFSSQWARAGIMVRERLDDGAADGAMGRYCTSHTDPPTAFDNDTSPGGVIAETTLSSPTIGSMPTAPRRLAAAARGRSIPTPGSASSGRAM